MKKYIKPATEVFAVKGETLLLGVSDIHNETSTSGEQLGKGNSLWDDDEE